jgi:excinuclease ABC subunit A
VSAGSEGGDGGAEIVAVGMPEEVAKAKGSHTGRFLREVLARRDRGARSAPREAAE